MQIFLKHYELNWIKIIPKNMFSLKVRTNYFQTLAVEQTTVNSIKKQSVYNAFS